MNEITVDDLRVVPDQPLIDVREPDEYASGHVPWAVNIPMSEIDERMDELPDGAFNVICELGGRSGRAVEALAQRGYDATNVAGGTTAWREAGNDVA